MMSSRVLLARGASATIRNGTRRQQSTTVARGMYGLVAARAAGKQAPLSAWAFAGVAAGIATAALTQQGGQQRTFMEARRDSGLPVIMAGEPVKEPDTGIMFPPMVNGFTFMGCGVRIKYIFVKVYAVGSYLRPENFNGLMDNEAIERALLDPHNHRTIRIMMNREMTMDKYNDAIVEALKPRMKGRDLEKLDEFRKLNPAGTLEKGTELLMTIRGDTLLYKNAAGNVGTVQSEVFTRAMCDVYYGKDPVSPPAKAAVLESIRKL